MAGLPIIQKAINEQGEKTVQEQMAGLEYLIQWGTMTLQDAIDFSSIAIETTTAIQRFSDGIKGNPGDMPGVGGPIDVAIIHPEKGFIWLARKDLTLDGNVIEL